MRGAIAQRRCHDDRTMLTISLPFIFKSSCDLATELIACTVELQSHSLRWYPNLLQAKLVGDHTAVGTLNKTSVKKPISKRRKVEHVADPEDDFYLQCLYASVELFMQTGQVGAELLESPRRIVHVVDAYVEVDVALSLLLLLSLS